MHPAHLPSDPFTSVDAAWFNMDSPTNLAVITGVMVFSAPLDFDRLQVTIAARLLPFVRFRQRVRTAGLPLGLPRWELDPDFDLDFHLRRVRLEEPGGQAGLQDFVGELMSVPLDRSKPLWQLFYIENVGEGSALVARLHHCIADGIALLQVLLSLTDDTADAVWPKPYQEPEQQLSRLARVLLPAVKLAKSIDHTLDTVGAIVHEGMESIVHPSRLADSARAGTNASLALGKLLLLPPDRRTIFKQKSGAAKRAAWSGGIRVEQVKAVGNRMGGTINDILLSAVTGALRRYLEERGEPYEGLNIRAIVPVNLRPPEELGKLGNQFGLVFLSLPVGVSDPVKRLVVLKRRMDAIKNSPEALMALGILNVIGLTPRQVEKIIITIFGLKGSAVMTNVPGPREMLYLAGKPVTSIMFWVPAPANLTIGVSIFSYAGEVYLGVATDAGVVPDPERIIELFGIEFAFLDRWGRPLDKQSTSLSG